MLLIFTRYDADTESFFRESVVSFANSFTSCKSSPIIILTDSKLPVKLGQYLNSIFKSVVTISPAMFIIERSSTDGKDKGHLSFIEVMLKYSQYDRLYFDPTLYYSSPFSIPTETSMFFRQHTGMLSMKFAFLKAGEMFKIAINTFKRGQEISTLTDIEFSYIVTNNTKILKRLNQKSIVYGIALDKSNIRELPLDSIIAIDLTNIRSISAKIKDIISSIEKRRTQPIRLSKISSNRSIIYTRLAEIGLNNSVQLDKSQIELETPVIINGPLACIITRPDTFNPFESVKKMILSKFSNLSEHNNTLVILGYNTGCDLTKYRKEYLGWKIVIYQLEQIFDNKSFWYNLDSSDPGIVSRTRTSKKLLAECDEIWDYDLDNIDFLIREGFQNIKHVPLVYSESVIHDIKNKRKDRDILFYGSINDRRAVFLEEACKNFDILILAPNQDCSKYHDRPFGKFMRPTMFGTELFDLISKSKVVLNIHYYESILQEQVRIFELIATGVTVISEKSRRNYFGSLIHEFDGPSEMVTVLTKVLKNDVWKNDTLQKSFKKFSENPPVKIGAAYNTFYGFDLIDMSINSIRSYVDHIVLVHQTIGINGTTEDSKTEKKIKSLLKSRKIDEVIYHDPPIGKFNVQKHILEKRNIGLDRCRLAGCEFIMPMDADEIYDMSELIPEIKKMKIDLIDTLYSPIRSYYYDTFHWFLDTYYVPSVLRIDQRSFSIQKSSVLVDPVRKMKEEVFRVSKVPMHHYTYLKDSFIDKVTRRVSLIDPTCKANMLRILEHLSNWKESDDALVFTNDLTNNGNVIVSEIKLNKIQKPDEKKSSRNKSLIQ